jgi:molybdate transport system substrate-binding protein
VNNSRLAASVAIGFVVAWTQGIAAEGAEIRVLTAAGVTAAFSDLAPRFERMANHKLALKFVPGPVVQREIAAGETFDVAISQPDIIDNLIKDGKIVGGTRIEIARSSLGIAVRTGALKPDISSIDAFRRALLNAKSLAYNNEGGASGVYFASLLDRLQITADMRPKLVPRLAADLFGAVARGEAAMVVGSVPAIVSVPGVELVGPLPPELQVWVVFTGGITTASKESDAAKELLAYLTTPAAAQIFKARGYESIAR